MSFTPVAGSTVVDVVPSLVHEIPTVDDPLGEALHFLRMDGMFYCRSELTAPWGIDLPPMPDCLWFHVVTEGSCILIDSGNRHHHLEAGDVVVLPHGAGHRALDALDTPTPVVFDLPHDYISRQYAVLRHGDGGQAVNLICGVVQLGHPAARTLLDVLPELIHVTATDVETEWTWLPPMLELMAHETQSARPGGETVVTRLCDVLVIQAIRWWINSGAAADDGWIAAMRDAQIGRSIGLMHGDPARDWTVSSLAGEVAMSRSAFSARFTDLVGRSPKQYLTRWRMQLAEDLLRREQLPIAAVASQLGYQSEAAFSRAFKRETGEAPSRARRRPDIVDMAQDHAGSAM
jgi:AraC-like DNA-binding protein